MFDYIRLDLATLLIIVFENLTQMKCATGIVQLQIIILVVDEGTSHHLARLD
jgi:hypothetical protein